MRQSLLLREQTGDLLQVAKSFNNLGNFYSRMGEVDAAIAAHNEAIQLYQKLNSQELEAEAWLNQGVVYHTAGQQRAAIEKYHQSLEISQRLRLVLAEVTAHANLVEAHAELGEITIAERHWHYAHALSTQADFGDELDYLQELRTRLGLTDKQGSSQSPVSQGSSILPPAPLPLPPRALLAPDELAVLELAETEGQVSPKAIMAHLHVSKATATRRLTALTTTRLLVKRGKGRGTVYLPATSLPARAKSTPATLPSPTLPTAKSDCGLEHPIQTLYRAISPELGRIRRRYAVTTIALVCPAPRDPHCWQLAVQFAREPTLGQFFALEQLFGNCCGCPVDLLPWETMRETLGEEQITQLPRINLDHELDTLV
ncbi:MAG: tetratricopeptide repeat protein [Caldilineaceae bacterium]